MKEEFKIKLINFQQFYKGRLTFIKILCFQLNSPDNNFMIFLDHNKIKKMASFTHENPLQQLEHRVSRSNTK